MKNLNNYINEQLYNKTFTYVINFDLSKKVSVKFANKYLRQANMLLYLKADIKKHSNETTIKPVDLV